MSIAYYLKITHELVEKMRDAGFSDSAFASFVESLPTRRYGNMDKGLLRKLYLAHLGLAEFSLKTGQKVKMYNRNSFSDEEEEGFRDFISCEAAVHKDDEHGFDNVIDLGNLNLYLPLQPCEKEIKLADMLARLATSSVTLANVWHGKWLNYHREFIPEKWFEIVNKGGRIIFPGVRLVHKDNPHDQPDRIMYPYFKKGVTGDFDYDYSMQLFYGSDGKYPEKLKKGRDHLAFFKPNKK